MHMTLHSSGYYYETKLWVRCHISDRGLCVRKAAREVDIPISHRCMGSTPLIRSLSQYLKIPKIIFFTRNFWRLKRISSSAATSCGWRMFIFLFLDVVSLLFQLVAKISCEKGRKEIYNLKLKKSKLKAPEEGIRILITIKSVRKYWHR